MRPRPRQAFCLASGQAKAGFSRAEPHAMPSAFSAVVYSPREIATAAGVPEECAIVAIGRADALLPHRDALRIGRELAREGRHRLAGPPPRPLFSIFLTAVAYNRATGVPLALSSTLHAGLIGLALFITTFGLSPTAATLGANEQASKPMRLVFMATPGPGGGGGGGGRLQRLTPPKALREGRRTVSSPLPMRQPPKPIVPAPAPSEPNPVILNAEPLPVLVAPLVTAPADPRNRIGVLEETGAQADSHGSGQGGGIGTGSGTGIGQGDGSGVGPGSGGGTGGGPYRPGSGIEPPRLVREVKADYTEEARRRAVQGEVVLEIVVRQDGSVGDVRVLKGLAGGLDDRAVQAVRQWRFAPARRQNAPVDVVVEVAVEFKLR